MPSSMSDLRVAAVSYLVDQDGVHTLVNSASGAHWTRLATTGDEVAKVDGLRRELRNRDAVTEGRTPLLNEFAAEWGNRLLPPEILAAPPDVLVLVPHNWLHDLPLHLVQCHGRPLGTLCGVSYASSHTLFIRCTQRNTRRTRADAGMFDAGPPWTGPVQNRSMITAVANVNSPTDELFGIVASAVSGAFSAADSVRTVTAHVSTAELAGNDVQESPDVLCLIAHGWIDPEDRLFSGLLVLGDTGLTNYFHVTVNGKVLSLRLLPFAEPPATRNETTQNETRRAALLSAAQLEIFFECRQELILLLGCSAGSGALMSGDQPASLAESFLQCGAVSVVAPLWDIDVRSTARWAGAFLEAWHRGALPKAIAARHAFSEMNAAGIGLGRAGALTLRGDWI
jgi:CHAT domain